MICDYHFQKAFAFLEQNIYIKKNEKNIKRKKYEDIFSLSVYR